MGSGGEDAEARKPYRSFSQRMGKMFACSKINRIVIPVHRFVGLAFMLQWIAAVLCWTLLPVRYYLHHTPIWFTMPVGAIVQGVSAAYYFRYLTPKKADPGFMSMGDVGRLSWFFVCENIFFAMLLAFQNCYYHPYFPMPSGGGGAAANATSTGASGLEALGRGSAYAVEAAFVFLPYFWRPLFPKTALRDSHKHREKNTDPANLDFYAKNTYIIKAFYNFAKHYIGFFLNYVRFMDRVVMCVAPLAAPLRSAPHRCAHRCAQQPAGTSCWHSCSVSSRLDVPACGLRSSDLR